MKLRSDELVGIMRRLKVSSVTVILVVTNNMYVLIKINETSTAVHASAHVDGGIS